MSEGRDDYDHLYLMGKDQDPGEYPEYRHFIRKWADPYMTGLAKDQDSGNDYLDTMCHPSKNWEPVGNTEARRAKALKGKYIPELGYRVP